ncbi:proton-conducting transporter membrane subunit [Streptomyces albogriseolus]|uniref:proton-conducting transporter transmembrane domain-containing protein n=2 Tax=Streptomyces albogriseolus TaxID=1887 RepID=UPI003461785C
MGTGMWCSLGTRGAARDTRRRACGTACADGRSPGRPDRRCGGHRRRRGRDRDRRAAPHGDAAEVRSAGRHAVRRPGLERVWQPAILTLLRAGIAQGARAASADAGWRPGCSPHGAPWLSCSPGPGGTGSRRGRGPTGRWAGFARGRRHVRSRRPGTDVNRPLLLAVIAAVTMTPGNLTAFFQSSGTRLLAYSTISQVGYLLMALAVATRTDLAQKNLLFCLAALAVANTVASLFCYLRWLAPLFRLAPAEPSARAFAVSGRWSAATAYTAGAASLLLGIAAGAVLPLTTGPLLP